MKHRAKFNWDRAPVTENWPRELKGTQTARAIAAPMNGNQKRQIKLGQCTPENATILLEHIRSGASYRTAASLMGMPLVTLEAWRKRDPELNMVLEQARGEAALALENAIHGAGRSGDTRAAKDWLQASEKGSWSDTGRGGGVSISFSFDRDRLPGVVIEGEAADAS